jgi:hypothetical protein
MEANGYLAVNNDKTIFMKRKGKQFIVHGLFVDDMMHIAANNKLKHEFMEKYHDSRDFNITGGGFMKTLEIEQSNRSIKLHLDHYVHGMLNQYKGCIKKSLRPKPVPILPGVILRPEDSPTLQDPSKQKFYRSFVATLQFAASGSSSGTFSGSSLSAQAGPHPRDGPAGPHLCATIAGPARGAARLTRLCSNVAYGQSYIIKYKTC